MIKFTCAHCDQKIRVAENASGKKGRCPKCRQTVTVPELAFPELSSGLKLIEPDSVLPESGQTMISYECQMCRKMLKSPKADEGKIKECPHCGCFVEIADPNKSQIPQVEEKPEVQPESSIPEDYVDPFTIPKESTEEKRPTRILPFYLDIFLYPFSKSGLFWLIAFTLAPILLYPIALFGVLGPLFYLGLMICAWAYMVWYFSLCIQKSAEGEIRAPDSFNEDRNVGVGAMVVQMLKTVLLIIICLLPPFIYLSITGNQGVLFYAILTGCIFFLPMMLLASVMFDSFWGAWNPRVIIGGMFSSFFEYIVLVIAFSITMAIYFLIKHVGSEQGNLMLRLVLNGCSTYMIMVSSHLLGWFFYKNEEKLYWSV